MAYFKREGSERRGSRGRSDDRGSRGRSEDRGRSRPFDSGGFSDRRGRTEMHDAICDKCGKECQLPFKPSSGKPVYCRDCFQKKDSYGSADRPAQRDTSSEQLNEINTKLDKIMKVLKID